LAPQGGCRTWVRWGGRRVPPQWNQMGAALPTLAHPAAERLRADCKGRSHPGGAAAEAEWGWTWGLSVVLLGSGRKAGGSARVSNRLPEATNLAASGSRGDAVRPLLRPRGDLLLARGYPASHLQLGLPPRRGPRHHPPSPIPGNLACFFGSWPSWPLDQRYWVLP
jgi:hypothetical protein